ncbi:transcriptional regulator [Agrobacterium sp. rho-13.3]|uniref:HVO_A0114 family putative DNA-binding protein n=1 Tax=Agrobacterium sp. rho-13.3 TaxID=3072980 RepID=UPI002A0C1804|nr:transcriptional regulator [Agrobacterium sp. rho-13.3]MDX8307711.1 transcriptional regulator [Agrobacterium sp. rho-13.3]
MTKALIQIRQDEDDLAAISSMGDRFVKAWETGDKQHPVSILTFTSPAQLFSVITPKRWKLIEQLQKIGPITIRGLSRALERDVKRVHDDISSLMEWGIIEKNDDGMIFVPFDEIEADFVLRASQAA